MFSPQDTKARGRSSDLRVVFLRAPPGFHPTLSIQTTKDFTLDLFYFQIKTSIPSYMCFICCSL